MTPSANARICVMRPADGRFGDEVYEGTGTAVAGRVVQALQTHFTHVQLLDAKDEIEAFAQRKAHDGRFLIVPRLVHWEEHAMNWSGRPDHVKVQLSLRDIRDDAVTRLVTFEGRQGHGLHFTDSPAEDLLTEKFDAAVLVLMGVSDSAESGRR
jgi:uncharacterized protein DUF4823